jgi:hypothetical protein
MLSFGESKNLPDESLIVVLIYKINFKIASGTQRSFQKE